MFNARNDNNKKNTAVSILKEKQINKKWNNHLHNNFQIVLKEILAILYKSQTWETVINLAVEK